jgi:hypothetical protein
MKRRMIAAAGLFLIASACLSTAGSAQTGSSYGNMVFVNVTVTDSKKEFAHGLKREQFQVTEDGVEQKLAYFSEEGPWNFEIILGLDALRLKRADRDSLAIREAIDTFKHNAGDNNQYNIDELPFGSNGLHDAITRAIDRIRMVSNPRKAVIVIADGFDFNGGGDPGSKLVEFAKKYNVPVYSMFFRDISNQDVAITELGRGGRPSQNTDAQNIQRGIDPGADAFQQVAELTGGQYMSTDLVTDTVGGSNSKYTGMDAACKKLALELKNQYVVGFNSTNDAKDNKYRKLKVTVKPAAGASKVNVAAKGRYFVPKG